MSLLWLAHWIVCVLCYWPMITYDTQLKSALNSSELLFLTGWHNSCETDDKFSLLNSPVWVDFYQGVFSRYKNCLPSLVTTVFAKHPILLIGDLQIISATKEWNINKWPSVTRDHFNLEPRFSVPLNQHSRTERPGKNWLQIRKISHSRLNCACLLFYFWSFSLLFRPIKIDPATELSRVTRLRRKEVRAWPSLKSEKVLYSDQIGI